MIEIKNQLERRVYPIAIKDGKQVADFSKVIGVGSYPSNVEALLICDSFHEKAIKGKHSYVIFKDDGTYTPDLNNDVQKYHV